MNLHTLRRGKSALAVALCAAALSQSGMAQVAPPTILQIDLADFVIYRHDTTDALKNATDPNPVALTALRNFYQVTQLADVVAVNGQQVKGSFASTQVNLGLRPEPVNGQAIADTVRNTLATITLEILKSDGTQIGTITAIGLTGGTPPPGSPVTAPVSVAGGPNLAITGGTGAFLGTGGQIGSLSHFARITSVAEDPTNRRRNGGGAGTWRWIAHVIPMARPEVTMLPAGPAITHSGDFTLVTVSKPAAQGEILSLFATGLGPVVPGVDPG